MGKEHSKGMVPQLEGSPIEVTDSYVLNEANFNGTSCSVFSGSPSNALDLLANNLKTHRHPNILKYVSSGTHDGRFYIVTEEVKPLFQVIATQTPLHICVGVHSIVSALMFLQNQANSSHNNVCCASIFVTKDGSWKLGGLEFMCKFPLVTSTKLRELSARRYEPAMAPEERNSSINPASIDVYALGVLINEVFAPHQNSDLPGLRDILEFNKAKILQPEPKIRASLAEISGHSFFSHDFIRIHRFLTELAIRSSEEKVKFFRDLESQLKTLPESMVASQLLNLLLARVVVVDSSAQNILPMLLRPKTDGVEDGSLFSEATFRQFVVPKILQMFCVRDTSVRLLLLTHLQSFISCFTREALLNQLLPELLVGIKDESDELVASTLHALAFLVGILGGAAVVGGKRARLFSDGRPATRRPRPEAALPERPSPDGGEDTVPDDTDAWSDWEQQASSEEKAEPLLIEKSPVIEERNFPKKTPPVAVTLADLDTLDIKNGGGWRDDKGPDFFSDMEPVIKKTQVAVVTRDKFQVNDASAAGDAWEPFEDWGET